MSELDLLVVTGASRGIGANIAKACAGLSGKSILLGSSNAINEVQLPGNPEGVVRLQLDIADFPRAQAVVQEAIGSARYGRIGVVLCAAKLGPAGGLLRADLNAWDEIYRCNVLGNLAVLRAALEARKEGACLRAVIFAGGGAGYGYPEFSGYALSKVAVVRAVENLGMEFRACEEDASIVAVAPGAVATEMLALVKAHGGVVRTETDISEPTNFARRFIIDELPSPQLNGRFVHVRDAIMDLDFSTLSDQHFKLRRVE